MKNNLLEAINSEITSTFIDKLSNYLSESRENTSQAVSAMNPIILALLRLKSKDQNQAEIIFNLSTEKDLTDLFQDKNLTEVFEQNLHALILKGNSVIQALFNDKESNLKHGISEFSNVSEESAKGILAALLPFILNLLGKEILAQDLSSSNLLEYFEQEEVHFISEIPVGLNPVLSQLGLYKLKNQENSPYHKSDNSNVSTKIEKERRTRFDDLDEDEFDNEPVGYLKWLFPLLGIVAALALLWFVMKKCQNDNPIEQNNAQDTISMLYPLEAIQTLEIK